MQNKVQGNTNKNTCCVDEEKRRVRPIQDRTWKEIKDMKKRFKILNSLTVCLWYIDGVQKK